MSLKKVIVYVRVSTDDQNTDRQSHEITEILHTKGYTDENIEVFSEHISGFTRMQDRPILNIQLDRIRNNPDQFDALCVHELSRLGRDPIGTRTLIDEFTELGVNIFIKSLNINTITNGKRDWITNVLLQILLEYSQLEVDTFKTRSFSGLRKSVREGKMGGGIFHPYGYRKDENKMMVIDEEESQVVKKIYHLYLKGNGIRVISNILNEEGIPTRLSKSYPEKKFKFGIEKLGKDFKWSDKQVHDILTKTTYIGKREFSKMIYDCPPIIDEETFDVCNKILKSKNSKGSSRYTYLLKDKLTCGTCGKNYYGRYKPEENKDKIYKCISTRYTKGSCGSTGINIKLIEGVIYHFSGIIIPLINQLNFSQITKKGLKDNLELLKNEKISLDYEKLNIGNKLSRLLTLYEDGILDKKSYFDRRETHEKSLKHKTLRIKTLTKDIKNKTQQLENSTQDEFLNSNINRNELKDYFSKIYKEIVVLKTTPDEVKIKLIIPLHDENLIKCFLTLDKKGLRIKPKRYTYRLFDIRGVFNEKPFGIFSLNYRTIHDKLLPLTKESVIRDYNMKDMIKALKGYGAINTGDNDIDFKHFFPHLIDKKFYEFGQWFNVSDEFLLEMESEEEGDLTPQHSTTFS